MVCKAFLDASSLVFRPSDRIRYRSYPIIITPPSLYQFCRAVRRSGRCFAVTSCRTCHTRFVSRLCLKRSAWIQTAVHTFTLLLSRFLCHFLNSQTQFRTVFSGQTTSAVLNFRLSDSSTVWKNVTTCK